MTRVTPLYETLFDLAYPLPKLFWMATPAFDGAIEHWGLITGNSGGTDWYEGKGEASKHSIASHVSHEVAHQWYVGASVIPVHTTSLQGDKKRLHAVANKCNGLLCVINVDESSGSPTLLPWSGGMIYGSMRLSQPTLPTA